MKPMILFLAIGSLAWALGVSAADLQVENCHDVIETGQSFSDINGRGELIERVQVTRLPKTYDAESQFKHLLIKKAWLDKKFVKSKQKPLLVISLLGKNRSVVFRKDLKGWKLWPAKNTYYWSQGFTGIHNLSPVIKRMESGKKGVKSMNLTIYRGRIPLCGYEIPVTSLLNHLPDPGK